jgi:DNA-binding LytR/AlgR family response regulator
MPKSKKLIATQLRQSCPKRYHDLSFFLQVLSRKSKWPFFFSRHYTTDIGQLTYYQKKMETHLEKRVNRKNRFLLSRSRTLVIVPTTEIAFFYSRNDCTIAKCLNGKEYFAKYSLDRLQTQVLADQFARLNRRYLVNLLAIKEIEPYYDRRLLVTLHLPTPDLLLVSKEKRTEFLFWLEGGGYE